MHDAEVYRPPSKQPRGAWAHHIHEQRRQRDLSQTQAFELVYEGLGLGPKSRAAYTAIDMGDRQPNAREAAYLASVFGWPEETASAPQAELDPYAVITAHTAALTEQTAAIERLVAAIAAATSFALEDSAEGSAPDQPSDDEPGSSRRTQPA